MQFGPGTLASLERYICTTWPECNCYSFLSRWSDLLSDEEKAWDRNDLEIGEVMIFHKLLCVQQRCPDEDIRAKVKGELRDPFWDRQRAMDH